jgi:Tfp pilus assembly protein PilO
MKKEQQKYVLIGIIIAALLYGYYSYLYQPLIKNIKVKQKELKEQQARLKEVESKAGILSKLKKESYDMKRKLIIASLRLPAQLKSYEIIKSINDVELKNNVSLTPIEVQQIEDKGSYLVLPIKTNLTTDYSTFTNFINGISSIVRIIAISDVQLKATGTGEKSINAQLELKGFAFKGADIPIPNEEKKLILKGIKIQPLYTQFPKIRDPFTPITQEELSKILVFDVKKLKLTGIINFQASRTAILKDSNGVLYTLKYGKLYKQLTQGEEIIENVTGKVFKDKVLLYQKGEKVIFHLEK